MNFELMLKNVMTPVIAALAAWLAKKLPFIDAATWNDWINAFFGAIMAGALAWFNRPTNIIDAAGKQAGTTVVTTKGIAASLPANPDVVPATPRIVAAVNEVK